jgi:hypothetical protein
LNCSCEIDLLASVLDLHREQAQSHLLDELRSSGKSVRDAWNAANPSNQDELHRF